MVSAVSTSVVPKITVIVGGSFGAGHYAMCGKAYDPRFLFAWPTARYGVMSGASAANTLAEVRAKQMERGGKSLSEAEKKALYDEIKSTYDAQADPRYGPPMDRRDHRSGQDPGDLDGGARGLRPQSRHPKIQPGSSADLTTQIGMCQQETSVNESNPRERDQCGRQRDLRGCMISSFLPLSVCCAQEKHWLAKTVDEGRARRSMV
jgi:hypothetical protein